MLTAKAERLWDPYGEVTAEDVRHMQSRAIVLQSTAQGWMRGKGAGAQRIAKAATEALYVPAIHVSNQAYSCRRTWASPIS